MRLESAGELPSITVSIQANETAGDHVIRMKVSVLDGEDRWLSVPDDIPLAKLTVQCTRNIVTGAVGDGVAPHLLTLGEHGVRERGS